MQFIQTINIKRSVPGMHPLPEYATPGAAAIDLRAAECARIGRDKPVSVKTGIHIELPDGVCALLLPRSGLGNKGLFMSNTIGLIDSDYRGQIHVPLLWRGKSNFFHINEGDRIAQLMFIKYEKFNLNLVTEFNQTTLRGEGGFGSTGVE